MLNKKGQVTIFVILGIVLLATTIIVLSTTKKTDQLNSNSPILDQVNYVVNTCFDDLTRTNMTEIINQGGFIEENIYPQNVLIYQNQIFLTTYDRYGDSTHITSNTKLNFANSILELLRNEFQYCATSTLSLINERYKENLEEFTIDFFSIHLDQDVFLIDYEYTTIIDGQEFVYTNFYRLNSEKFKILEHADQFTEQFFKSYDEPDIYFNLDKCEELFLLKGIKPRYPLDFLKFYEDYGVTAIVLEEDFFIIKTYYDGLEFNYAIRPELIPAIC
ncbi:MAG: hypothetical protein ACLFN8_03840 [Candidatus Woesearchaeota archaeon]